MMIQRLHSPSSVYMCGRYLCARLADAASRRRHIQYILRCCCTSNRLLRNTNGNVMSGGKLVVGVIADFIRQDEGEYTCPQCTVFGVDEDEVKALIASGLKMTDRNREDEGYEVKTSAFKLMRELGRQFGYAPDGDFQCTEAPNGRKTLIWTLVKDA